MVLDLSAEIPEYFILAKKVQDLLKSFSYIISSKGVVYGLGGEQCILLIGDPNGGGGYIWSADEEHTVHFGFVLQPHLLQGSNDLINSVRFFSDYDYLYYHSDLTHFTVFKDSGNLSDCTTIELHDFESLTDDVLFQYSLILSERELLVYIVSTYLKYIRSSSICLRLEYIDEIFERTHQKEVGISDTPYYIK